MDVDCPSCGSDDVRGERNPGGTITLTCQSCQASWDRIPEQSCPRCGKGDVETYGAQRTFRCLQCHHTWGQAR